MCGRIPSGFGVKSELVGSEGDAIRMDERAMGSHCKPATASAPAPFAEGASAAVGKGPTYDTGLCHDRYASDHPLAHLPTPELPKQRSPHPIRSDHIGRAVPASPAPRPRHRAYLA